MRTVFDDPFPDAPPSMAEVARSSLTLRSWLRLGVLKTPQFRVLRSGSCECHDGAGHIVVDDEYGDVAVCVTGCWGDHESDFA